MIRSRSGGGGGKKASGRILEEELYSKRDVLRDGKTGVMVMPKWSGKIGANSAGHAQDEIDLFFVVWW